MAPPRPGKPTRASRSGRPIMVLLDLLGRRWVLRIIWELRGEPLGFRALQAACDGMSPSVLALRLEELVDAGIAEPRDGTYTLTDEGRLLREYLAPMRSWAERWAARVAENDAGPSPTAG